MSWIGWRGVVIAQMWGSVVSADCWVEAGIRHSVEPELLYAIAQIESGLKPGAINQNTNGSRDIGLMQINSMHLPRLLELGITEQRLLEEPCLAVDVGASILAEFIARHGYNWTAVGAYNAGSSSDRHVPRLRYAQKVWNRYQALFGGESASAGL